MRDQVAVDLTVVNARAAIAVGALHHQHAHGARARKWLFWSRPCFASMVLGATCGPAFPLAGAAVEGGIVIERDHVFSAYENVDTVQVGVLRGGSIALVE